MDRLVTWPTLRSAPAPRCSHRDEFESFSIIPWWRRPGGQLVPDPICWRTLTRVVFRRPSSAGDVELPLTRARQSRGARAPREFPPTQQPQAWMGPRPSIAGAVTGRRTGHRGRGVGVGALDSARSRTNAPNSGNAGPSGGGTGVGAQSVGELAAGGRVAYMRRRREGSNAACAGRTTESKQCECGRSVSRCAIPHRRHPPGAKPRTPQPEASGRRSGDGIGKGRAGSRGCCSNGCYAAGSGGTVGMHDREWQELTQGVSCGAGREHRRGRLDRWWLGGRSEPTRDSVVRSEPRNAEPLMSCIGF